METYNRDGERRIWQRAKKDLRRLSLMNRKNGSIHLSEEIYLFCKFVDNEMGIAYEDWRKVYADGILDDSFLGEGEGI